MKREERATSYLIDLHDILLEMLVEGDFTEDRLKETLPIIDEVNEFLNEIIV